MIREDSPSLWIFVAPALGFTVTHAVIGDSTYRTALAALFPTVKFSSPGRRARGHGLSVDVVFSTQSALPHKSQSYWSFWRMPHLFFGPTDVSTEAPPGWTLVTHRLSHSAVGGSTDGVHLISLLLPTPSSPEAHPSSLLPTQPWVPVEAAIDSRFGARPATSPDKPTQRLSAVSWIGSDLSPFGLFPSDALGTVV